VIIALAASRPGHQRVLVSLTERPRIPVIERLDRGVRTSLQEPAGDRLDILSDTLDLMRFGERRLQDEQFDWHRRKYARRNAELIIGIGSACIGRVPHRDRGVFARLPIVFATVCDPSLPTGLPPPRVTGALDPFDAGGGTRPGSDSRSTRHVYQGPGGSTVIHGGKHGEYTGPRGNEIAGGKIGTVVIGPNANVHASGTKGAAVKTPGGTAVIGEHGGATDGPGGVTAHGSRGGVATGPRGTVAAGSHGAVAVGPHGAVASGGPLVAGRGAYGGGYGSTRFVAAGDLRNQGDYLRRSFGYYNAVTRRCYTDHPGAWFAAGLAAGAIWAAANWSAASSFCGYPSNSGATYYNYGDNVTYQDGQVYYDDQPYATEAQYARQASQFADTGQQQPPNDTRWQPLGVFAMVKGDETTSNDLFELAIDKNGVVRGNY
jgi:hypothetical protein